MCSNAERRHEHGQEETPSASPLVISNMISVPDIGFSLHKKLHFPEQLVFERLEVAFEASRAYGIAVTDEGNR